MPNKSFEKKSLKKKSFKKKYQRKSIKKKSLKKKSFRKRKNLRGGTNNTQPSLELIDNKLSNTSSEYHTPRTDISEFYTPRQYAPSLFDDLDLDVARNIARRLNVSNLEKYSNISESNEKIANDVDIKYSAEKNTLLEKIHKTEGMKNLDKILYKMPEKFRYDKEIMLSFINKDGYYLYQASDRLLQDKELIIAAIKNNPNIVGIMPQKVSRDIYSKEDGTPPDPDIEKVTIESFLKLKDRFNDRFRYEVNDIPSGNEFTEENLFNFIEKYDTDIL